MSTNEQLQQKAREECLQRAHAEFPGDLMVTINTTEREWDSIFLREMFHQTMVVWRKTSQFEVLLDPETNRPVGFEDHAAWHGCETAPLTAEEIMEMASRTGLADPHMKLASFQSGSKGCIEALLKPTRQSRVRRSLRVQINAKRRLVISIWPESQNRGPS